MLNVCLSFDHELFLGENFRSEKDILIDPTYRIMELLGKHNVCATFFTDICAITRYSELGKEEFPKLMKEQLQQLVKAGHDVQLHIHANWLKSSFADGSWTMDSTGYRIQYFTPEKESQNNNWTMGRIIKTGKDMLEEWLREVDNNYSCRAFRAGGFCIQPEKELISCLIENGIVIDSSIAPGIRSAHSVVNYDFTQCPKNQMNWHFGPGKGISWPVTGRGKSLYEVPIATCQRSILNWLLIKDRCIETKPHKGSFVCANKDSTPTPEIESPRKRLMNFIKTPVVLSLDFWDADVLADLIGRIYRKNKCQRNEVFISVISHPKLLNDALFNNIDKFIREVGKMPGTRFCTFQDIGKL